ncbi:hypothetical protein ABT115_08570 [Streptomyces sp. NPDC001832]|uniref:hypothetical protein n=1 Tax=Streptomyces sp. NPDC001832 TaxID=3154527 RepID=UPI0033214827
MNEKRDDAESIMAELESQMALDGLEKRGDYAAGIAIMAGKVMSSAMAYGVPYALAEEMATDFWKAEMLADTIAALVRDADEGTE